jgi:CheY-like chemotaxis protein
MRSSSCSGCATTSRSSPRSANAAIEYRPDVMLMDYRMPVMDGVEATAQVRALAPEVAVVALTASANAAERDALVEAGAVTCLRKDQELDDIVAAVLHAAAPAAR